MNNFRNHLIKCHKIIKIKIRKASKLKIQTLLLEIGLIAKQWFRKVKVKIEVTK